MDRVVNKECGLCHREASRLATRRAYVEVKCCPQCVAKLDAEDEEQMMRDALKFMVASERKQFFRELSYKWADRLNGKSVVVFWDEDTHPHYCSPSSKYSARGMSYRMQNASGGWGQVRIDIDPAENCRIRKNLMHPDYGIIDGQAFGLSLTAVGNGDWYTMVSWGCRKAMGLLE